MLSLHPSVGIAVAIQGCDGVHEGGVIGRGGIVIAEGGCANGYAACVGDRVSDVVASGICGVLARVDVLNDGLSVRTVVRLYDGGISRGGGREDGRGKGEGVKVGSFRDSGIVEDDQ